MEFKGSCTLTLVTNSCWEDNIKSNTFPSLVGSKTYLEGNNPVVQVETDGRQPQLSQISSIVYDYG